MHILVFFLHVCLCTLCMNGLQRLEENIGATGTGVTDRCEPPCAFWELNPAPLEKEPVLLAAEPSSHPQFSFIFNEQVYEHTYNF